jgi:hypothetical protein
MENSCRSPRSDALTVLNLHRQWSPEADSQRRAIAEQKRSAALDAYARGHEEILHLEAREAGQGSDWLNRVYGMDFQSHSKAWRKKAGDRDPTVVFQKVAKPSETSVRIHGPNASLIG